MRRLSVGDTATGTFGLHKLSTSLTASAGGDVLSRKPLPSPAVTSRHASPGGASGTYCEHLQVGEGKDGEVNNLVAIPNARTEAVALRVFHGALVVRESGFLVRPMPNAMVRFTVPTC